MSQISVCCPQCEKVYRVNTSDLYEGEPQFQCAECQAKFGLKWPQPPGVDFAHTFMVDEPVAKPQTDVTQSEVHQEVPNVVAKSRTQNLRMVKSTPTIPDEPHDLRAAWDTVKNDFGNEAKHEAFVQYCLQKNRLNYASQQYRQIIMANPAEPTALRMQERIINLATVTFLTPRERKAAGGRRNMWLTMLFMLGALLVVSGISKTELHSLIAIGFSCIVFSYILRPAKS